MRSLTGTGSRNRPTERTPSRWAWRVERLMLTPLFLVFLRAGVPLVLVFGLASWWLSDEGRRDAIWQTVAEARASFETRPEFMVHLLAIDGAEDQLAQEIREEIPLNFPVSSFDLDLGALRDRVTALDPVKTATARIRPGGVLQIEVTPRTPVVIWRNRKGLALVDISGAHIKSIERRLDRPDLPLIAGVGATSHLKEGLDLYRAAAPLGGRLRGIVRMGERRWDVVLDRDQRILLPEAGAVEALERVIALDGLQDIFSRDISRVDMRLGMRPTVQMSKHATDMWWDILQVSGQ